MSRNIAIFDFDHTLITGDSFWPFLTYVAGRAATYAALSEGLGRLALAQAKGKIPEARTFLKTHLLNRLLAGRRRDDLRDAAMRTQQWQTWHSPIRQELDFHAARGDMIVIASGGLDLYLPECLHDTPHHGLICTDIGVEDGVITGVMIKGNCVRHRKAERVAEFLATQSDIGETFAYGNYPHDMPMMELTKHRIIV